MAEFIIGGLALLISFFAWLLHGATSNRMRDKEQELDEWSGVLDVKRKVDNDLNDPAERKRVREKYNKAD